MITINLALLLKHVSRGSDITGNVLNANLFLTKHSSRSFSFSTYFNYFIRRCKIKRCVSNFTQTEYSQFIHLNLTALRLFGHFRLSHVFRQSSKCVFSLEKIRTTVLLVRIMYVKHRFKIP